MHVGVMHVPEGPHMCVDMHDCRAHASTLCTCDGNLQALMRVAFQGLLTSVLTSYYN